jgi:hypothetical protein
MGSPVDDTFAMRLAARRGAGTNLPTGSRTVFEDRLGADFGGVRIHNDAEANAMARAIGAIAFTAGTDIYVATDRQPDQRILSHELTHVLQQRLLPRDSGLIQRMIACPDRLEDRQPTPAGWQSYHGDSSWFHCGFRVILEDRVPTRDDPQNECVYDHQGALVGPGHPYEGCRGTPNQYDSADAPLRHTLIDSGGIVRAGAPAFATSRVHTVVTAIVAAIEAVETTRTMIRSAADGLADWIAVGVLTAAASVEPGNWVFQGLPARSVRHLNVIGAVLSSASLVPNLDVLLRNLTRRLDSYAISELVGELAADISSVDTTTAGGNPAVTVASLAELNLVSLIELLRSRGLLRFVRPPEDVGRERLAAARAAAPPRTP